MEYTTTMAKRKKKKNEVNFSKLCIIVGLFLLSIWGIHRYFYIRAMTLSNAILAQYANKPLLSSPPVHITVGNHISLSVVEAGKIDGTWAISPTGANHVHESASPGIPGNTIIYAHNAGNLFGPLDKISIGDAITVRTTDGKLYQYTVVLVSWVTPGHTELLAPTTHEVLTLYTCAGILDSLRIVVRAVPL